MFQVRLLIYLALDEAILTLLVLSCTKPGGWVEFQDWDAQARSDDGSLKGTALERYFVEVFDAFEKAGYTTRPGPYLKEWFCEAGFVDVHVKKYYVPQGVWPKDPYYVCEARFLYITIANFKLQKTIGTWNLLQAEPGVRSCAMAVLTRFKSWTPEEVEVLAAGALNDIKNPKIHALYDL